MTHLETFALVPSSEVPLIYLCLVSSCEYVYGGAGVNDLLNHLKSEDIHVPISYTQIECFLLIMMSSKIHFFKIFDAKKNQKKLQKLIIKKQIKRSTTQLTRPKWAIESQTKSMSSPPLQSSSRQAEASQCNEAKQSN